MRYAIALVLTAFTSSLYAQEVTPDLWQRETLLGDWGGARTSLAQRGIDIDFIYTGDVFSNVSGGIDRETEYLANVDLLVTLDTEKSLGLKGGTFLLYLLGNYGGNPSEHVGDIQGVSNITAPNTAKLYEAWYQQNLFANRLSLLAGLYDLNLEFDTIQAAQLFLHGSHGIGAEYGLRSFDFSDDVARRARESETHSQLLH